MSLTGQCVLGSHLENAHTIYKHQRGLVFVYCVTARSLSSQQARSRGGVTGYDKLISMGKNISRPIIYCVVVALLLGGIYVVFNPRIIGEYLTLIIISIPVAVIIAISDMRGSKRSTIEKDKFELLPKDIQQQIVSKQRRKLFLALVIVVIVIIIFFNISSKL